MSTTTLALAHPAVPQQLVLVNSDNLTPSTQRELSALTALPESTQQSLRDLYAQRLAPASRRALHSDMKQFSLWLSEHHPEVRFVAQATRSHCLAHLSYMHTEKNSSQASIKRMLSSMRSMVRAWKDNTIDPAIVEACDNTIRALMRVTQPDGARGKEPLLRHEVHTMVAGLRDGGGEAGALLMFKAYLLLSFASACRINELRQLRLRDVEHVPQGVVLSLRQTKSGRPQRVEVSRQASTEHCPVVALQQWLDVCPHQTPEAYVFRKVNGWTGAVTDKIASEKDLRACIKRGAEQLGRDSTRVSGHSTRKGFATTVLTEQGTTMLSAVQQHLRHAAPSTTLNSYLCAQSSGFAHGF